MKKRRLATFLGLGLMAVLLGNHGFRRIVSGALELRRLRHELTSLEKEEGSLRNQIRRTQKSDFALESAARRELGYLRPGEVEYRFPPPQLGGR